MPEHIITPQQIEKATYRISCGSGHGTAFFIADNLLITAAHVVSDGIENETAIILHYGENDGEALDQLPCTIVAHGEDELDVALLQIEGNKPSGQLPLYNAPFRYDANWETFGYPFEYQYSGNRYQGTVRKTNSDLPYDIELTANPIDNTLDYGGLSGAPLVIEKKVTGIMTWNILDGFGAISINKISGFLENNNIVFETHRKVSDLPDNFLEDMESAIPNAATFSKLDEKMINGGEYYLLHGSPGSGKTLIAASYQFEKKDAEVAGRYFIRLPNDSRPISFRTSREAFLEWFEDLVSQKISGTVFPKKLISLNERIKNLKELLTALNEYYQERKQVGFLIIDGLDDLDTSPPGLTEFLSMLPESLPSNLSVVLSIIRKDSLPPLLQAKISVAEEILVTPLEINQCAYYLDKSRGEQDPQVAFNVLQEIAEKSEGHPLYLRYLAETLKVIPAEEIESWIDHLPTIGGDIAKYYEQLWLTDFASDNEKFWIAFTVSQLRQPLVTDDLLKTLPEAARLAFFIKFPAIRHLFKVNGKTGIYHNSFSLFLENKAPGLLTTAHDHIKEFCDEVPDHIYSITNIIYHVLNSTDPLPAIAFCNQEWADKCARISVEPELILSDIQKVENFCIENGHFTALLRIKFLLQRIRFRYNNLLAQNASAIAEVLLSIGKPSDALRYLVRSAALIVSDDDALKFLRRFYEMGAAKEADSLLKAIQKRYRAMFEQDKAQGSIRFRVYKLMANAITISAVKDPESSLNQISGLLKHLKRLSKEPENSADGTNGIELLRQNIGAYHTGFFAYHFNSYKKSAAAFKENMPKVPPEEWTGRLAHNAIFFDHFLDREKTPGQEKINLAMVEDVEYAYDSFGYVKADAIFILSALLEDSRRSDIVRTLIEDVYHDVPEDRLRQVNGVDADVPHLFKIINHQEGKGYLDENNQYPSQRALFGSVWESALIDRFKLLGFCFGKAWRLRADGSTANLPGVFAHIENLIKGLAFSLADRSRWDRSYAIPEQVFPHLYYQLTRFYVDFYQDGVAGYLDGILKNAKEQFGLYTEGYRSSLHSIANKLARYVKFRGNAFAVVKLMEAHILVATLNRWERTPALLDIAELYGRLNNIDKVQAIYQEMLDSSMGPTWYKEDQFTLINTALALALVDNETAPFQKFAVQLQSASGEITFQRYVRVAQQIFIKNMIEQGNTFAAISYFKYQTTPDAFQIIENAEASVVDAVRPGDGYVLGARSIIEASGIANLLEKIDADPVMIWAHAEIFIISNDIYRYLREFATIQAECLNRLRSAERFSELTKLHQRLAVIINFQEMARNRHQYLDELDAVLSAADKEAISAYSIKFPEPRERSVSTDTPENDEMYDSMEFPGMGKHSNFRKLPEYIRQAAEEKAMDNPKAAGDKLAAALNLLHDGKSDIWMGSSLGKEVKELWQEIPKVYTVTEIIQHLKEPITNHYSHDWRVAEKLIRVVKNQLDSSQTEEIMEIISDHIWLMIRNPDSIPSFNWEYHCEKEPAPNDEQLGGLLIWLLNHPYISVKIRVIDSIYHVCKLRPTFIKTILEHAISEDPNVSREICSYMLYELCTTYGTEMGTAFSDVPFIKEKLVGEKHFMIKYYFLKTAELLAPQNSFLKSLYEDIFKSFSTFIKPGGDIFLDEPYLGLVKELINYFEADGTLNGAFCRNFLANIEVFSLPLSMYGQIRAGHYLERSYHDEEEHYRRGVHILRNAFNHAVLPRIVRDKIEEAAVILTIPFLNEI